MRHSMKKADSIDFTAGKKVEIVSNEEGLFGSFYEATIVSCVDNDQYVVRYKNFLKDDGSKKPLTETKFLKEIRPLPPGVQIPEFLIGQLVNAFDNDGWWLGKITGKKFHDDRYEWEYNVYFHTTDDEIWYPANQIRIHHEWVCGQWFTQIMIS